MDTPLRDRDRLRRAGPEGSVHGGCPEQAAQRGGSRAAVVGPAGVDRGGGGR